MNSYLENTKNKMEVYIGGGFAIIAIVAIIAKTIVSGISADTLLDMVINIAGLAVSALVMFVAIRSIISNTSNKVSSVLELSLGKWVKSNQSLIFKALDFPIDKGTRYYMTTDHKRILTDPLFLPEAVIEKLSYGKPGYPNGRFLEIPQLNDMLSKNFTINFFVNTSTFLETIEIKRAHEIKDQKAIDVELAAILSRISSCINVRYDGVYTSESKGKELKVYVSKIDTIEKARDFLNFLNFVMMLYLIQS